MSFNQFTKIKSDCAVFRKEKQKAQDTERNAKCFPIKDNS